MDIARFAPLGCLTLPNDVFFLCSLVQKDGIVRVVKYDCGTTALAKRIYRSCVDHHAFFR